MSDLPVFCVEDCEDCEVCNRLRDLGYKPVWVNVKKNKWARDRMLGRLIGKQFALPIVEVEGEMREAIGFIKEKEK